MKRVLRIIAIPLLLLTMLSALTSCFADSAYDIAVENGYTGNVVDWLADLEGEDLRIEDIYEAAKQNGYTGSFLAFLKEYLSFEEDALDEATASGGLNEALLASVSIQCGFSYQSQSGWYPTKRTTQAGSGVILRLDRDAGDAYIVTNYHVVYYYASLTDDGISDDIRVYLYGQEDAAYAIDAEYVGGSMTHDIAVLKIEGSDILKESNATAVTVMDSNLIGVGKTAIAIGNAEGAGISVTRGIISVDSETVSMTASDNVSTATYRLIRVDTAVNEGNSGGGLFSDDGRLIGIVNAKIASGTVENIGYAIPSNVAVGVAENIIDHCDGKTQRHPLRCTLGITLSILESKAYYDSKTDTVQIRELVSVSAVDRDSVAYGRVQKNDILKELRIGDRTYEVTRSFIPVDALLSCRVGDTVVLTLIRDAAYVTVSFTITEASLVQIS